MNFDFKKTDINILVSILNMKLRDEFENITDLCAYYDIKRDELENKMEAEGFKYFDSNKQFIKSTAQK